MAYEYEKEEGGAGFVMGLLTGTVLGAGLGMLFAPKTGSDLRGQISDNASTLGRTASESYHKAAGAANTIAEKGREFYDRAKDAVSRGTEEAKRYTSGQPQQPGEPNRPVYGGEPRGSENR